MNDNSHTQGQGNPPEAFVKQVKQALEHLYDFPFLQHHPLVREGELTADHPDETPGQRLRRQLIAAIETLNPGPDVPFRALRARVYNLLILHYVEGMTVQEAAHELGVSRRQAHRDLRRGDESVAAVLWARRPPLSPQEPSTDQLSSFQAEMARMGTHSRPTDIRSLLAGAQEAVEPMASQRRIRIQVESPAKPVLIPTDPVMARQVLISLFSYAVGQAQPGPLPLALTTVEKQVSLTMRYIPEPEATSGPVVNDVVAQLADRLGWTIRQEEQPGGTRTATLHMTSRCPTVLVIDDNEGLVELLTDYLTSHSCQVIVATSGPEGLQLAQETPPDAIILDVMMPGMDGWELLQRLRTHPRTTAIPVIICSVINNPELAYSLGASLFVPKPVSRDDILKALHQVGAV